MTLITDDVAASARYSVDLIQRLQDPSGAYPASPTFSAYRGFSWFRDGAFIADAMSAAGAGTSAEAFFDWCARMLVERRARVERIVAAAEAGNPVPDSEMLDTRFTFDGHPGDAEWWDFQLDGYGTWLWAAAQHAARTGGDLERWRAGVELSVDYLMSSWQRPCYDWWEEHTDQVHVSTLGCIAAGLDAVAPALDDARAEAARHTVAAIRARIAADGTAHGRLTKWLGSDRLDASLLALVSPLRFEPAAGAVGAATLAAIAAELEVDGGVHRYADDTYFGGGQWPLLSCMLGLARLDAGDRDGAMRSLRWAVSTATASGDLPEQVDWHLLHPEHEQEWIERWGPSAVPLLWSHAMVLRLAVELGVVGAGRGAA